MSRRLDWHYNEDKEEFITPSGRTVSLQEIAGMLNDQLHCRHDFTGEWSGWKMRGAKLIPPRGSHRGPCITPYNGAAFARWLAVDGGFHRSADQHIHHADTITTPQRGKP